MTGRGRRRLPLGALLVATGLAAAGLFTSAAAASGAPRADRARAGLSVTEAGEAMTPPLADAAALRASAARRPHPHGTPPPRRPHPHRRPWPVSIVIRTMPVLEGIRMTFDGEEYVTDHDGVFTVTAEHDFGGHTLTLVDTGSYRDRLHYQFVRWTGQRDPDQAYRATVTRLPRRAGYTVTAVFRIDYPVTPTVVDTAGAPVTAGAVEALTVRGEDGTAVSLTPGIETWLAGRVPASRAGEVELRTATYTLQSITVDGTNTVDAGQQSFRPADGLAVVFRAKFFDLRVVARDALFRRLLPGTARVTLPNGRVVHAPLDRDHVAVLPHLPRGAYSVDVSAGGSSLPTHVVLSRDLRSEVVVATERDQMTLAVGGLAVAGGLLLLGRGRALPRRVLLASTVLPRRIEQVRASIPVRPSPGHAVRPGPLVPPLGVVRMAMLALPVPAPRWVAAHAVRTSPRSEEGS